VPDFYASNLLKSRVIKKAFSLSLTFWHAMKSNQGTPGTNCQIIKKAQGWDVTF
jgi:hypothetical protein